MEYNVFNNIPDEKEYIISGTMEEIVSILMADFGLDYEEARFIVYVSTIEKEDTVVVEQDELKLWYMDEKVPSTGGKAPLPYTISVTKFKLKMNYALYLFLGKFVLTEKLGIVELSLGLIWALKEAIQKISENEYCVYAMIIRFVHQTKQETFDVQDIIPYEGDNECNRKPDRGVCPYWNQEKCSLNEERIINILNVLNERGLLRKCNKRWVVIK